MLTHQPRVAKPPKLGSLAADLTSESYLQELLSAVNFSLIGKVSLNYLTLIVDLGEDGLPEQLIEPLRLNAVNAIRKNLAAWDFHDPSVR